MLQGQDAVEFVKLKNLEAAYKTASEPVPDDIRCALEDFADECEEQEEEEEEEECGCEY